MQQLVRIPRGVDEVCVLRSDVRRGTVTVEISTLGKVRQIEIPQIALRRHERRRAARKGVSR